jgi:hypothetical protein
MKSSDPKSLETVNYRLIGNKNGKFDWRPFELIHPVIYASLVNLMTEPNAWGELIVRFNTFKKTNLIDCVSLPIASNSRLSKKGKQIKNWWEEVEQRTLELSLEFDYIFQTDIASCYPSIYTHSIPWALYGKESGKKNKHTQNLGNSIDQHLMSMNYGQTNGIPQGSMLMDFIAELVIGYADEQFTERVRREEIDTASFKIIRYRDDYKIFTNNPQEAEQLVKILTEVFIDLGMKLNADKTFESKEILIDGLKRDKLGWLQSNAEYVSRSKKYPQRIQLLHSFANMYPNSGTLVKQITKLHKDLRTQSLVIGDQRIKKVMIAYIVDIAINHPKAYSVCSAVLSKLLTLITNKKVKQEIFTNIMRKFAKVPNTGLIEVWLQRIILKQTDYSILFREPLCEIAAGKQFFLWDVSWLKPEVQKILEETSILNKVKLDSLPKVIKPEEVNPFAY